MAWKPRVAIMPPLSSLMAPYALPITTKVASWQFSLCESTSSPSRKQHNYDVVITTKWCFDIIVTSRYRNVLCKINQVIPYIYISSSLGTSTPEFPTPQGWPMPGDQVWYRCNLTLVLLNPSNCPSDFPLFVKLRSGNQYIIHWNVRTTLNSYYRKMFGWAYMQIVTIWRKDKTYTSHQYWTCSNW